MANDILSLWQKESRELIPQHFEMFHSLVTQARDFAENGNYDMAAVYGEMAAKYASGKHCGLFVSLELERILVSIGQNAIANSSYLKKNSFSAGIPQKVLHVATSMLTIGGHSRNLWRWVQQDPDRTHCLILTRQAPDQVPKSLQDAIVNSGGSVYVLNQTIGSIISWARQLRKIAADFDLVVLHTHSWDIIPIIAFADKQNSPPVFFLDHADHIFWLGTSVIDVLVSHRESGMNLARERRNIDAKRTLLLPIVLEPTTRVLSRTEAKRQLDLPENSVLLISIARGLKYKTIDGINFAAAHVPLLKLYQQAILIVIGPGGMEDWSDAIGQTEGRIRVLKETEYTSVFYQAADIYVDSFPFVSNTSLLEAGSYGVPLVSRYPYSSQASGVLGADMPGLTGNLIRVGDLDEYTKILSRLIEDEKFRLELGEATRTKIEETHLASKWQSSVDEIYSLAATVTKTPEMPDLKDRICLDEPDVFMPFVHNVNINLDGMTKRYLPLMPVGERLYHWFNLVKKYGFRDNSVTFLLPEWFRLRYYLNLRSWWRS